MIYGDPTSAVLPGESNNPELPLPYIHSIADTPQYGKGGALITRVGYYKEDRLWYEPSTALKTMPGIPKEPTQIDVKKARSLLCNDLLGDFPFVTEADKATMIAAFILPFVIRRFDGQTPIHLIEAPVQGSGKTILASLVSIVATGKASVPIIFSQSEEENHKALAAELSKRKPIITIDNVDTSYRPLKSPTLSSITTESYFSSRILGTSEMMEIPNQAVWIMTGNNVKIAQDLIRRFIRCRIDPGEENPWMRNPKQFRHPDIKQWTKENRSQIVHAILTLCEAWRQSEKDLEVKSLGSFEAWSETIGGILEVAEIPGFLDNLEDFYGMSNEESESFAPLIQAWQEEFGNSPVKAKHLQELCESKELMLETRGHGTDHSQRTRLGRALKSANGRVFGNRKIMAQMDKRSKTLEYCLTPIQTDE